MHRLIFILTFLFLALFSAGAAQPEVAAVVYVTQPADYESGYPNFDLYVINSLDGARIFESVTPNRDCPLELSPDGEWLIYQQDAVENGELKVTHYLVELRTGTQTQIDLSSSLLGQSSIMWIPDSQSFLFTDNQYENNTIFRFDIETASFIPIIQSEQYLRLMQLGNRIFYQAGSGDLTSIDDPDEIIATVGFSATFEMRTPSPDGRFLTFSVFEEQEIDQYGTVIGEIDFIISPVNGRDFMTISDAYRRHDQFAGIDAYRLPQTLSWRPDSQAVFYLDLDGNFVVYDFERQQKSLFHAARSIYAQDMYSFWSPDGRYVVYEINRGGYSGDMNQYFLGIVDTMTGNLGGFSYNDYNNNAGFVRWVSQNQFVFISGTNGMNPSASSFRSDDLIRFDIETQTYVQLTETPELTELSDCWRG